MRALVLLLAFALSACATPVPQEKLAAYKRVGVISLLGDDFRQAAVGITVFGNEYKRIKVATGVDAMLETVTRENLRERYELVDLSKYRPGFPETDRTPVNMDRPPPLKDVVRTQLGAEKLDAYIVIVDGLVRVRNTNQNTSGAGILKLQRFLSRDAYLLHLGYTIYVVDGHDFSYASIVGAAPDGENGFYSGFEDSRLSAPNVNVSADYHTDPAAHVEAIRAELERMARGNLPQTLKATGLLK